MYITLTGKMEVFKLSPFASSSSTTSTSSNSAFGAFQVDPDAPSAPRVEREHLFDKVVTPSDVGKLNRLVIPKQYAERYFPLEPATADRGLTLSFEDRTGKQWQFRYSYWNSSQSYVMTKGWSRFVKEKQLDAGDTVSFGRGVGESAQGRLFIDWRRQELPRYRPPLPIPQFAPGQHMGPWGGLFPPALPSMYDAASLGMGNGRQPYFYFSSVGSRPHAQVQDGSSDGRTLMGRPAPVLGSVPLVARGVAERKRVRLFGVNLECSEPDDG